MSAEYIGPYLISNLVALGLVLTAWRWPRVTRYLFALIFLAASLANTVIVLKSPSSYVEGYGELAVLPIYKSFIYGFFSRYTIPIVLLIALGQVILFGLLSFKESLVFWGVLAASFFLFTITPLGLGSAFPCTLILTLALWIMLWKLQQPYKPFQNRHVTIPRFKREAK